MNNTYYLSQHSDLNEASSTTKLRVVFGRSAKTSNSISNDVLKVGPNVQDELFDIILRFCESNVVVTADNAKMYRQVNVIQTQKDLQSILWHGNTKTSWSTIYSTHLLTASLEQRT